MVSDKTHKYQRVDEQMRVIDHVHYAGDEDVLVQGQDGIDGVREHKDHVAEEHRQHAPRHLVCRRCVLAAGQVLLVASHLEHEHSLINVMTNLKEHVQHVGFSMPV